jgi:hypothetical protein
MPFPERAISEVNKKIDPDARMKCHRCESIMIYEKFYGPTNIFGDGGVSAAERL